jgi:hypothetical protein
MATEKAVSPVMAAEKPDSKRLRTKYDAAF